MALSHRQPAGRDPSTATVGRRAQESRRPDGGAGVSSGGRAEARAGEAVREVWRADGLLRGHDSSTRRRAIRRSLGSPLEGADGAAVGHHGRFLARTQFT